MLGMSAAAVAGCATAPKEAATPSDTPSKAPGRLAGRSPNEKLNIACVGVGGQGQHDLRSVAHENIVALCDVDGQRAAPSFRAFPDAPKYSDYREMFDTQKDIDAVVIAIPDHMHAFVAMTAMQLGKHVYVEKPMAHSIAETRILAEAAKRAGVVTQMGNQGHSMPGVWQLCHMIEAGVIGPVREVHAWTNRPTWPQGKQRPTDTPPVPESLNWDVWLGSAPERPYHPDYLPHRWRGWWDFGCCAMGDMGCHILDAPYMALKLGAPVRLSAESTGVNDETGPLRSQIHFEFPARGSMPPVTIHWQDGIKLPPTFDGIPAGTMIGDRDGGSLFVGEKGMIHVGTYGNGPTIMPESLMQDYLKSAPPRPDARSHHRSWIEACKGGPNCLSHFDYAAPFTEVVLLGNVALRAGQPIEWDSAAMRVTNLPEANRFVSINYRNGWTL